MASHERDLEKALSSLGYCAWQSCLESEEDMDDLSELLNEPMVQGLSDPIEFPIEYYKIFMAYYLEKHNFRPIKAVAPPEEGKMVLDKEYEIGAHDLLIALALVAFIFRDNWPKCGQR